MVVWTIAGAGAADGAATGAGACATTAAAARTTALAGRIGAAMAGAPAGMNETMTVTRSPNEDGPSFRRLATAGSSPMC